MRLVRQLLTEAALLTVAGCAFGAILLAATLNLLVHHASAQIPRLAEVRVDLRVLAIGIAIATLTTILFTLLPSLSVNRIDMKQSLERAGRVAASAYYQLSKRALIVAEVALSLVLLSSAALLLQSLWHLRNDHLGFQPAHSLTMTIPIKGTKVEGNNRPAFVADLLRFARTAPGTIEAAQSECTPLTVGTSMVTFSRADRPLPEAFSRGNSLRVCGVGAGYDRASGQHLILGRFFKDSDFDHPQTLCVINQAAAHANFPGEDPLGKRILGGRAAN